MKASEVEAFKEWLTVRGAIVKAPTNEWEIIRFLSDEGTGIVYRNKANRLTFSGDAARAYAAFFERQDLPLAPNVARRSRKEEAEILALFARDGNECFFECGEILTLETATREHLVPVCHGGPDHPSNKVLACENCNRLAGNKPVIEKVQMRECNMLSRLIEKDKAA